MNTQNLTGSNVVHSDRETRNSSRSSTRSTLLKRINTRASASDSVHTKKHRVSSDVHRKKTEATQNLKKLNLKPSVEISSSSNRRVSERLKKTQHRQTRKFSSRNVDEKPCTSSNISKDDSAEGEINPDDVEISSSNSSSHSESCQRFDNTLTGLSDTKQIYNLTSNEIQQIRRKNSTHVNNNDKTLKQSPNSLIGANISLSPSFPRQLRSVSQSSNSLLMLRRRIPSKNNPPPELSSWLTTFRNWTHAEKLMALDNLVNCCEPTQVRHLMSIIEPQFQRDFISLLPKELALCVLSFLDPRDLCRAAQTCHYWHILAEDNLLWREKCREENLLDSLSNRRKFNSKNCLMSPWKVLYRGQHLVEQNWRHAPIKGVKVLKGHDDHVITCLELSGTRIVCGSDDNTLKVWSIITGKCLRTLVGHTGGVWSSQMSGNIIISGSTDRTLKVWNADTGQCTHTLFGHTSTVRCMHLHGSQVVSGSRDATLRVWDVKHGRCVHVLMGHVAAVRCVQYDGRRVVSGAYDYMVKVWDPSTETCLHTLAGHTNRVYSLQFDGVHIVSGSLDTSIRVWDVESGNCLHTLIGHQSLTSGMELKDNILVSGNADSTVKVWDITTGQCLQTLQGSHKHQSAVTCLQFSRKFVITSSDDGTVKLWDLRTGDFLRNLVSLESGGSGGVVWRIRANNTKLIAAVGSRNGTEETKLLVLDFDVQDNQTQTTVLNSSTELSNSSHNRQVHT